MPEALQFLEAFSKTQVDIEQQIELIKNRIEERSFVLKRHSNLQNITY